MTPNEMSEYSKDLLERGLISERDFANLNPAVYRWPGDSMGLSGPELNEVLKNRKMNVYEDLEMTAQMTPLAHQKADLRDLAARLRAISARDGVDLTV